jgi:hypothetical protein
MKQLLDLARVAGPDHTPWLPVTATCSPGLSPAPPKDIPISNESSRALSDGGVWVILVTLLLVTIAASYLFWAKLSSAWPFAL